MEIGAGSGRKEMERRDKVGDGMIGGRARRGRSRRSSRRRRRYERTMWRTRRYGGGRG